MGHVTCSHPLYSYVSQKAACDPCRTIYVCPPASAAANVEEAERFAVRTGWKALAEEDGAVLVIPVVPDGWSKEPKSLLMDIYKETCNGFLSESKQAIWGRQGRLWCWETMLYLAGYEDGAVYAGNVLAEYPNLFAAAALVNGVPDDYPAADACSDHWLVPQVSAGYRRKKREIPVHLWLFLEDCREAEEALRYFGESYGAYRESGTDVEGLCGRMRVSAENPACQMRVFGGSFAPEDIGLARVIMKQCFRHVIRWKNGPDGTLALTDSREEFYQNPRFLRRSVTVGDNRYDYFVHLPAGKRGEALQKLPLVFTVHGRGEPAWLFTSKNGWDELADRTGEFILVSPDSPGNIWFLPRDGMVFPEIVHHMVEEFGIDEKRVYLTGFSNGGMMVREVAVRYPGLFAGVSPWNAPVGNTGAMQRADTSDMKPEYDEEFTAVLDAFLESGYEMPCAFVFGDKDKAANADTDLMIGPMVRANNLIETERREEKDFSAVSYQNEDGETLVTVTVWKDMPHGAVREESRLTWEFLRRFRREGGARRITLSGPEK